MKKITLYVGLNDKDTKTQKIETLEAYKIVMNTILNYFDGCTIYTTDGIYRHENGEITIEKTFKIELITNDLEKVETIISTLKIVLNQESILKQTEIVNCEFV